MSTGLDKTALVPGPPFHLVPDHYSWMLRADLPPGTRSYRDAVDEIRPDYDSYVGGHSQTEPLARALLWFERQVEVPASLLHWATSFTPSVPKTHRLDRRNR